MAKSLLRIQKKCNFTTGKHHKEKIMKIPTKITYIVYCINSFGEKYGLNSRQAYAYLKRFKGIEFLDECYEAEHLLSINDAVNDLSMLCKRNGGALG